MIIRSHTHDAHPLTARSIIRAECKPQWLLVVVPLADTFLEKLTHSRASRGLPAPITVGLGLQEQLAVEVPVAEHDFELDYVCLPDTLLSKRNR